MITVLKSCVGCGGSFPRELIVHSRCPVCLQANPRLLAKTLTGSWSPDRSPAHTRWARAVRARAGNQCEAMRGMLRCPETERLQAHHLVKGSYRLEDGVLLCPTHHRAVDPQARAT